MPAFLLVRLYRALPILIVLGILAVLVYLVVSWRHTPTHAKLALIKVFTVANGGLTAFLGLATVYALLDGNEFVADFFFWCGVMTAILLGITLLCRRRFFKKHPKFRWKLTVSPKTDKNQN